MKYKFRILELTQKEHAKVLQSVIMSMNNGSLGRGLCMANQMGGESMCMNMNNLQNLEEDMNRFHEINKNELIDVSDEDAGEDESEDESEDADSDTDSSESSSDSENDVEEDHVDDSCNTKKIVITNSHDSHKVEHLTGPDIKVIELTHPLYPSNENVDNDEDDEDNNDNDECDDEDDSKSESESDSESSDERQHQHEHEDDIKDNMVEQQSHEHTLEDYTNIPIDNSLDNISVTTVFKNKSSDTSVDYNTMTVSTLRQTLKNKLSSEGHHMSETSINKLSKKDLIKMLQ
jgi:hypothetical protein